MLKHRIKHMEASLPEFQLVSLWVVCASCFFIRICSCSWRNGCLLYPSVC